MQNAKQRLELYLRKRYVGARCLHGCQHDFADDDFVDHGAADEIDVDIFVPCSSAYTFGEVVPHSS